MKKVYALGLGPGNLSFTTASALEVLKEADVIIGAPRLLNEIKSICSVQFFEAVSLEDIFFALSKVADNKTPAVVFSGDIGSFSGFNKFSEVAAELYEVVAIPGISAVQYMAAKMRMQWTNWNIQSAHGKSLNFFEELRKGKPLFLFLDSQNSAHHFLERAFDAGFGDIQVSVGEHLGYEDERIESGSVEELRILEFKPLSVALFIPSMSCHDAISSAYARQSIPDSEFIRGSAPMTKEEVRSVIVSKLDIHDGETILDIGSGSGSVTVALAIASPHGKVHAIEFDDDALEITRRNVEYFNLRNVEIHKGMASSIIPNVRPPHKAFVGGSKHEMQTILSQLHALNSKIKIAISALTLETLSSALENLKNLDYKNIEVVQLGVSRSEKLSPSFTMLKPLNPVFIITAEGDGNA